MKPLIIGLLVFIALFIATFLGLGEFYYHYSMSVHRFPIIVGVATIVLAGIAGVRLLRKPRSAPESPLEAATALQWPRGTTAAMLWLVAALPMTILLGYLVGPTLYLLAYLRLHGERWITAITFAVLCALAIYFGFHHFLAVRVPLYPFWWPD